MSLLCSRTTNFLLKAGKYFSILILFLSSKYALSHELVPLDIIVNQVSIGESNVVLRDDGDVWVPLDAMRMLESSLPLKAVQYKNKLYVSLRAQRSRLHFKVDIERLQLLLTVQALYLKHTRINYAKTLAVETTPSKNAVFLNYSLLFRRSNDQSFNSWELPLEGVASINGLVIKTNYFYRQLLDQGYWTRGLTNISRDFNHGKQRLIAGDYFAASGDQGGSGIFTGISFSHNVSSNIMSYSNPGLSVNGILETPSRVDVYANGMLVRSEELPAGPYALDNIPNVFGAGEASLVVTDAFGREKTFSQSYYVSSQLLRKGMSEYSYNFGWRRNQVDAIALEYDSTPSVLAFHKKGILSFLTAGYRFDWDTDVWNIRPTLTLLLKQFGEIELLGAYSHYQRHNGYAFSGRYSYVGKRFHLRASMTYLDPWFAHSSYKPMDQSYHMTQNYGVGVHGHSLGSLSLVYARTASQEQGEEIRNDVVSLLYNRRLTRTINLYLRGGQIRRDGGAENSFLLGIHAILGRKASSSYAYNRTEELTTNTLSVQRSAPLGKGFGFRGRVWKDDRVEDDEGVDGDGLLIYKGENGTINLSYYRSHAISSSQYSLSGALALIDNHVYLTRPIYDSFGVANVGQLDDIDVYLASEHMGNTNDGRLLIPNLASYSPNRVKIDSEDVPVDYSLLSTENIIVPNYRSGSMVNFSVERFQAISGNLVFDDFGVKRTPEFASFTLAHGNDIHESVIGKGGQFYFENIAAGSYTATLLHQGQTCQFAVKVPESSEMLIDLGEQVCER